MTEGECLRHSLSGELAPPLPSVSISVPLCTASGVKIHLISLCKQAPYFPEARPAPRPHTASRDPFRSNQNGLT